MFGVFLEDSTSIAMRPCSSNQSWTAEVRIKFENASIVASIKYSSIDCRTFIGGVFRTGIPGPYRSGTRDRESDSRNEGIKLTSGTPTVISEGLRVEPRSASWIANSSAASLMVVRT